MATIGYDCEVLIDGTGYFIKPGAYAMKQPRVREMKYRADGSLSYVDLGPGRREWLLTVLCVNELKKYDGTAVTTTGEVFRDALRSSYTSNVGATINYTDPLNGSAIPVYFDSYEETVLDLHSQIIAVASGSITHGASYEVRVVLVEA